MQGTFFFILNVAIQTFLLKKLEMTQKYFINGNIPISTINEAINEINKDLQVGAISFFLGQVRNDLLNGKNVEKIIYSAYNSMAESELQKIEKITYNKYSDIQKIVILHSIGEVWAGETSLLVMIGSRHRTSAFNAELEIVEYIKANVPIWKKEILKDGSYVWTENK